MASINEEYEKIRVQHAGRTSAKDYISIADARENKHHVDFNEGNIYVPEKPGITVFDNYDLSELAKYIDWTPFFSTW